MTWKAAESRGAKYDFPGQPKTVYNEFVLRFDSAAEAHRAIADAWQVFTDCPTPAEVTAELPVPLVASNDDVIDEAFWGQRVEYTTARHSGLIVGMYALRAARRGNVIIVIEDVGEPDDRAGAILKTALGRAIRSQ